MHESSRIIAPNKKKHVSRGIILGTEIPRDVQWIQFNDDGDNRRVKDGRERKEGGKSDAFE